MDESYELAKALGEAQNELNQAQSEVVTLRNKLNTLYTELKDSKALVTRLEQMNANLDRVLREEREAQAIANPPPAAVDRG